MRVEDDISDPLSICVDESESTAPCFTFPQLLYTRVTDDHTLGARIVANVVGIVGELCCCEGLKRPPIKDFRCTIKSSGDEKTVRRRVIEDTLRFG